MPEAEALDFAVVDDPLEPLLFPLDEEAVDELEEPAELELEELDAGLVGWKVSLVGPKPMFDA